MRDLVSFGVDHAVLHGADAILSHIRTLNAIHLASALRSGIPELTVVTHDQTMSAVAERIGFAVLDPIQE